MNLNNAMVRLSAVSLLTFCFTLPAHALTITASNSKPKQGEPIEITVSELATNSDSGSKLPLIEFNGQKYELFNNSDTADSSAAKALLGIPADLKPGKYKLKCEGDSIELQVLDGKFPLQYLSMPKGKDNFLMSPGEEEGVNAAKATVSPERHWHGAFVPPSKARTSTLFGLKRVVNGKMLDDYFHSGLDFAGGLGSPIVATSDGKVILAHKNWRLHGNIIAIDHGQGVVSFYLHMNSFAVKEGDMITAGQKIGTIGSTGRANGPHLHFSIYVNKVATNPKNWFRNTF